MAAIAAIVDRSWVSGSSARLEIIGSSFPSWRRPRRARCSNAIARPRAISASRLARNRPAAALIQVSRRQPAPSRFAASDRSAAMPIRRSEYVDVDTIVPRAQALALTILRLDADFDQTEATVAEEISPSARGEQKTR